MHERFGFRMVLRKRRLIPEQIKTSVAPEPFRYRPSDNRPSFKRALPRQLSRRISSVVVDVLQLIR
jgi:hypothetical protein